MDGRPARNRVRGMTLSGAVAAIALWISGTVAIAQDGLFQREKLTGDWGGARSALSARGIEVGLIYIGETLTIARGGINPGSTYEGRLEASVDTDLEKLIGWKGASTHVKMFQIHKSPQNAADRVGSIADPSNIDAVPTTRLFTAWFQQNFFEDRISLRAGQLAADDEFLTSTTAGGLINGTFGWAATTASNIRNSGPAYPLATPGVRLALKPTAEISLLAAVFAGDPAGKNCIGLPQVCNKHGTTFSTHGGALWIGELQYQTNQAKDATGLASAYKIGAWYATAAYADMHFGDDGTGTLVTLATTPTPDNVYHHGNWGLYGVIDQMLWRSAERSTSVFVRGGLAPSDRNTVSWYIDGGIGFKGLLAGRPDDTLTIGAAHSRISKDLVALDRDTIALGSPGYPVRSGESVLEVSYIAQMAPWWTIQPDLQYIAKPGGNVPHPVTGSPVGNAVIVGVRSTINF